jgi:hypothetical protein
MTGIYLNDFEGGDVERVLREFNAHPEDRNLEILLADYRYEAYEGLAWVLYRKDGKLFEVHGSHCSCYGLEGQWEPEETTVESIRHRVKEGWLGDGRGKEMHTLLEKLA